MVPLIGGSSWERIALVERTEGTGHVAKFVNNGSLEFDQSDNQTDNQRRGDQDEFRGNQKAIIIGPEGAQHVRCPLAREFGAGKVERGEIKGGEVSGRVNGPDKSGNWRDDNAALVPNRRARVAGSVRYSRGWAAANA